MERFDYPLAVPEKIFGLPLVLDFFDRCANPCSLYPPLAALAGVARAASQRSVQPSSTKKAIPHNGGGWLLAEMERFELSRCD